MKFGIFLAFLFSSAAARAQGAVPFEYHAYARSNFQVANGLAQGSDDLHQGWGAHNRLQEGQYFELNLFGRPLPQASFVTTLSSGTTSYPYDNSVAASFFNVRNLYFEVNDVNDGRGVLWFGARMFRGDSIYIFDTWPLDDHDLIGGGYEQKNGDTQLDYVIGVNKDSAYGIPGNSWVRSGGNPTFSANTQRYIFIQKFETKLAEERRIKTNLEFQYLPKGIGTNIVAGSANNGATFSIPSDYGIMAGVQLNLWKGNTTVLNYGYGNVVGNWGSAYLPILTKTLTNVTSTTGTALTDVKATSAKKAQAASAAIYGTNEYGRWSVMYGEVPKYAKAASGQTGWTNTLGMRPLYYLSDRLHVGGEVDWITYMKRLKLDASEVPYVEVTPIVEYALSRTATGVPKFFVAAANAFYADKVTRNGRSSKYAFNGTIGMELWF